MPKPIVVIVGRPNVGKSTLFNRITKSRAAITDDIPGVTRDRNYLDAEWDGRQFVAVDTGGFHPEPSDDIFAQIKEQALFAIDEADVIIHLLDGKEGLLPADTEIARRLRESGKPVIWAVNKIDVPAHEDRTYEFFRLGIAEAIPVSAITGYGFADLMEKLVALLPPHTEEKTEYPAIAVVGRPNAGKSTLVNALLSKERMIVSPLPGTTRDAVDSICSYYGRKYLIIDTAGIRRKNMTGYSLERFAAARALKSIMRCDVALIVLDATEGIVEQDQRIAGIVENYGKGAIFLMNKWDLLEKSEDTRRRLLDEFNRKLWFMEYAPMLTVSALEKTRVTKIFPLVDKIIAERRKRIPTAELNRFLYSVQTTFALPPYRGKPVKLLYMTQVGIEPPAFALFANYPDALGDTHKRYIEKILRQQFSFSGTPIRLFVKREDRNA